MRSDTNHLKLRQELPRWQKHGITKPTEMAMVKGLEQISLSPEKSTLRPDMRLEASNLVHLLAYTMTFGRQSILANGVAKKRNIHDIAYFPRLVSPAP